MPNLYDLKLTRGAVRLQRRFDAGPDQRLRPPMGGGGTRVGLPGVSTAGRVSMKWSRRSQRHMRFEFGALPWELLGRRPVMITLTYPGEWQVFCPDSRTLAKHREALRSRWTRRFGTPVGVWVTEFQKRGAPHLHMYLGLPDSVSEGDYEGLQKRTIRRKHLERQVGSYAARRQLRAPSGEFASWLRDAWWEIVGSGLSAHHGRGVDIAAAFFSDEAEANTNRAKVAEYFWRESGKWGASTGPCRTCVGTSAAVSPGPAGVPPDSGRSHLHGGTNEATSWPGRCAGTRCCSPGSPTCTRPGGQPPSDLAVACGRSTGTGGSACGATHQPCSGSSACE